jgi:hypothetical protein
LSSFIFFVVKVRRFTLPKSALADGRRPYAVRLQLAASLPLAMRRNQTSASGNDERGLTTRRGISSCEIRAPKADVQLST